MQRKRGYLPPIPPAEVPPRREARLAKIRKSEAIPHVIPLLFTGPKPQAPEVVGADPAFQVAGGMASGPLRDASTRGPGSLTQNVVTAAPSGAAPLSDSGNIPNVTYVYITSPPNTPGGDTGEFFNRGGPSSNVRYGQQYASWGTGGSMFAAPGSPGTGPGGFVMQPAGSQDLLTGTTYNPNGSAMYNPQTGTMSLPGGSPPNLGYNVGGMVVPIRRTQQ